MKHSFADLLAICFTIIQVASSQLELGAFDHERGVNVTNAVFDDPVFDVDRSAGGGLKNSGKDCWRPCNKQNGPCEYCGTGACCRKGYARKGCDGSIGGDRHHSCVSLGSGSGVDGGWSNWSAWTKCSKTCGPGTKSRLRACTKPKPSGNGKLCSGKESQKTSCEMTACKENCGVKPSAASVKIIGGGEAGAYSLPWQVALVAPGSSTPFCGGTLISDRHVLTAAHCTAANNGVWDVMVGEHDISSSSDGTRHTVCRWQNHPNYNSPSRPNNDFAVVTLSQSVTIGPRANYACLPTSKMGGNFLDYKTVTVSGWGRLAGNGARPKVLYEVDLPVIPNSACRRLDILRNPVTDQMLCAGRTGDNAVGACHGDSGGPLTYTAGGKTTLVGAVSWGNPSCLGTTVFARVTEALPWIHKQMRKMDGCGNE